MRTERAMPFAAAGALAPTRGREKKDLEEYIENQEVSSSETADSSETIRTL